MNIKIIFFSLIGLLLFSPAFSTSTEDSLKLKISHHKKADILVRLAESYPDNPKKAIRYFQNAITLFSESNKDSNEVAKTYLKFLEYLYNHSDYNKALKVGKKALLVLAKFKNDTLLAPLHKKIGLIYESDGIYEKALPHYLKSLDYYTKLNDQTGIASNLNNIGLIYYYQKNYKQALENFKRALPIVEKLNFKFGIASVLTNIGNIYTAQNETEKAKKTYERVLKIDKEINDKEGVAKTLNNLGLIYSSMNDYITARSYFLKSIQFQKEIGNEQALAGIFENLSVSYEREVKENRDKKGISNETPYSPAEKEKFAKALKYLNKAKALALKYKLQDVRLRIYNERAYIYSELKNYKKAYGAMVDYDELRDSLQNEEMQKELGRMQAIYENDKKEKEIALQHMQIQKNNLKIEKQQTFQQALIAFIALLTLLAFAILRSYYQKKKANLLLASQKQEIESQNEIITLHKNELEEKNKDIMDSINYAKRIQTAILPPDNLVQYCFPESFIFYQPKDIVSGDFYWIDNVEHRRFAAAVDCTGHGVPGAFMSIVGYNALNLTLKNAHIYQPASILDNLNLILEETLRQKGKQDVRDGMDMSLIMYDTEKKELQYAGANNPLYIIRKKDIPMIIDGEEKEPNISNEHLNLYEIKATKQPIGAYDDKKPFENHIIKILDNDTIYMFSDGFADQFGGKDGKKYKYKPFKRLLLEHYPSTIKQQLSTLTTDFNEWKGELEQIDDVCVIGIKF